MNILKELESDLRYLREALAAILISTHQIERVIDNIEKMRGRL